MRKDRPYVNLGIMGPVREARLKTDSILQDQDYYTIILLLFAVLYIIQCSVTQHSITCAILRFI